MKAAKKQTGLKVVRQSKAKGKIESIFWSICSTSIISGSAAQKICSVLPLTVFWLPVVLLNSAWTPLAVLLPPVELKNERIDSSGGVVVARGVAKKGIEPDGGVVGTCGVAEQRPCPQAGVALRRRNPRQSERANERSYKDGEKRSRVGRMTRHIIPSLFVEFVSSTRTA